MSMSYRIELSYEPQKPEKRAHKKKGLVLLCPKE